LVDPQTISARQQTKTANWARSVMDQAQSNAA
jgi:hypothetical protein